MLSRALRGLRRGLRETFLALMYYSGALWLALRIRLRGRIIVLTYHRVLPKDRWAESFSTESIVVTPETFDRHMRFVRRHLRPVTAREFAAWLRGGDPPPKGACLVTFDDGWYDTLEFALPVLRWHLMPAVLFVPTGFVGTSGGFWQERMTCALWSLRKDDGIRAIIREHVPGFDVDPGMLEDRRRLRDFVTGLKSRPAAEVDGLLSALLARSGGQPADTEDRFLDWDGVAALQASGLVTIGSHGVSHRPMTGLAPAEVRDEIRESRDVLRRRLGREPAMLAYPNGDATPGVAELVGREGLEAAFTTVPGHVDRASDRFLLPRINIHEAAARHRWGFLGRILGFV